MSRILSSNQSSSASYNETVSLRWEWRTFGRGGSLASRVTPFVSSHADTPRIETYVLSSLTPHNVKLRADRLDVKWLARVDDAGLELWRPVVAERFPVAPAAILEACAAWGIAPPTMIARATSMAGFLANIVSAVQSLRVVTLRKARIRLHVLGCHGELVNLQIGGVTWQSVAFEDVDPERVSDALAYLGFDSRLNASYPAALKQIAVVDS